MLAYLVIRDDKKWSDVFKLAPGRRYTIGRGQTNQIVIREEQASRHHAEIFMDDGNWTVRDLESRNGTAIGTERISGDHILAAGDVIRIARTQLEFVENLNDAYLNRKKNSAIASKVDKNDMVKETVVGLEIDASAEEFDDPDLEVIEPTNITHRRTRARFHRSRSLAEEASIPRVGRAATTLCRLGFELANQPSLTSVANLAINGLFEGTRADSGSVLVRTKSILKPKERRDLEIVASRTSSSARYQKVSEFLAKTVLGTGEAVLAQDVEGDSSLAIRDSKGVIHSKSVICAPIRVEKRVVGLVHLYSTDELSLLDPDDLDFTLAVAENVGQAFKNLMQQQKLAEDLKVKRAEVDQLRAQLGVESEIIGSSETMLQVHQEISRAAPSKATVLIRGESGVGKELVARAVHFSSPRSKEPFVCLNCAALTETLLESELFGHERGAFTGATERKIGKFEAANKGTLMLDEIGEMSPSIQAKFLRVLEGHPFERVGGTKAIKADVRVIAATNRDLVKAVSEKKFRRDLYFRLHVIEIYVPPLRKRVEDAVEIAEHYLQKFNVETGRKIKMFSPESIDLLRNFSWPGNVRELRNAVESAVLRASEDVIQPEDFRLTSSMTTASESQHDFGTVRGYQPITLEELERQHILQTLKSTQWNKSRAASILGIERSTLDRKLKKYGVKRPSE